MVDLMPEDDQNISQKPKTEEMEVWFLNLGTLLEPKDCKKRGNARQE